MCWLLPTHNELPVIEYQGERPSSRGLLGGELNTMDQPQANIAHVGAYAFDAYRPEQEWWADDPTGIHGIGHTTRVLIWADRVAAGLEANTIAVDREVVRWAAILHDCRRDDDGADPAHGARAARWFDAHAADLAPALTPAQVSKVCYCMQWHVPPDRLSPRLTPELQALKDGDGLDRVRLGDFDAAYLRTPYLHGWEAVARQLWKATRPRLGQEPWSSVRAEALSRGLWR